MAKDLTRQWMRQLVAGRYIPYFEAWIHKMSTPELLLLHEMIIRHRPRRNIGRQLKEEKLALTSTLISQRTIKRINE